MLSNNGYIVKDLIDNEDLPVSRHVYRGLQSCHNWPLENEEDFTSKELTKSAMSLFEEHFGKYSYEYEIITDVGFLKEYVKHCRKLKLEITVMKIMSKNKAPISNTDLAEIELLGYDCMATESESYLVEIYVDDSDIFKPYDSIKARINSNGLLNTYKEVEDFIETRNKTIKDGLNLEDYWEPVPVRLSLVDI